MTNYNLIDEPWIPVLDTDGQHLHIGIREALLEGHRFVRIAAELPTVSMAIQRLLQAILLRVHQDLPKSVEARARLWGQWWEAGGLPPQHVDSYLQVWADQFDLLHPQLPFFQVPGLATASGKGSGLVKLMADVPDGTKFFVTRSQAGIESLAFAEAAQWLVHAQAFDCAGIKTGVLNDDRVTGGKSYSFGYPAWSGNIGVISLDGATLNETLLLNLVLSATSADDVPPWERAPQRIASDGVYPVPVGAAQAWTWPSRMIRLIHDGQTVVDVVLSNGERLAPQNRFREEPMTAWRYSEPQTKKEKITVYMPVQHNPERAAWRGLSALLAESVDGASSDGLKAGSLTWLQDLRAQEVINEDQRIALRCVGMQYGSNNSSFASDYDDSIPISVATLSTPRLRMIAVTAANDARRAVSELRNFAKNIALAAGDSGDTVNEKIRSVEMEAYSELHPLFDSWVVALSPTSVEEEVSRAWQHAVRATLTRVAHRLDRNAPHAAVTGRPITLRSGKTHMDLGKAGLWFQASLRKTLALTESSHDQPTESSS